MLRLKTRLALRDEWQRDGGRVPGAGPFLFARMDCRIGGGVCDGGKAG